MLKEATFRDKFALLLPWLPTVVEGVKKDLRGDHLKADIRFHKKYFAGKLAKKLTVPELVEAYAAEILEEGNEELAEFVCNRWLIKHAEIYECFEVHLEGLTEKFDELDELEAAVANKMLSEAEGQFGSIATYLFSVLNSVVFDEETYKALEERAQAEAQKNQEQAATADEERSLEKLQRDFERERVRLVNRYEKRLVGLERKYHNDVAALKKQVSMLQRKLDEQRAGA